MDIAQLILEYLKVLIWAPGLFLVLAVVIFRKQLKELFPAIRRIKLGAGEVELGEIAGKALEREVSEPASQLDKVVELEVSGSASEGAQEPEQVSGSGDVEAHAGVAEIGVQAQDATVQTAKATRRDLIEEIIRDAAGWGFDMAKIGVQTKPVPVVTWTSDSQPRIVLGQGSTPLRVQLSPPPSPGRIKFFDTGRLMATGTTRVERRRHNLEEEVRRLRLDRHEVQQRGDPDRTAHVTDELRRAEARLRDEFPESGVI